MKINRISKFLCIIPLIMLLVGFKGQSSITATPKGERRGIWAIPIGIGVNWKPKAEAKNNGWMGLVATTGIKWEQRFSTRYTFSAGLLWGLFLPDMFMKNKPVDFRILKVIVIPYNLALLLPMTSLQLGYLVKPLASLLWANLFIRCSIQCPLFDLFKNSA